MPQYAIKRQYLVPVYEHIFVEAPSLEEACRRALDELNEPWGDAAKTDYESARPITIERAVEIPDTVNIDENSLSHLLYTASLEPLEIPREFAEEPDLGRGAIGFV